MPTKLADSPDFSEQIDHLRKLEPPQEFALQLQFALILTACSATYFLTGWWVCIVWCFIYIATLICEKIVVRVVPDSPSKPVYGLVLAVLILEAIVFCFMPVYFWLMGLNITMFGSLALITASTMHTMLHRAAFPSILLCFLVPQASVFVVIPASSFFLDGPSTFTTLYMIGGLAMCVFFFSTFYQAFQKETKTRREMEERRAAEEALERSEEKYRTLFESAPVPVREEDLSGMKAMIDALEMPNSQALETYLDKHPEFLQAIASRIRVLDANKASLELHGYSDKSKMLSKVISKMSPPALEIVRMTILTIFNGGTGNSYVTKITRSNGQIRTVAAKWSVLPGHEPTYSRILLSSLDLTEQLNSEEALRHAQKMEAVGQLTGGVAHDFNNLLTVIGGNLDLMEDRAEFSRDTLVPIKKAVGRGAELTSRLLAFSRKQPLTPQVVNLASLVSELRVMIARTLGEEITVSTHFKADLWSALADPGQVEAALLNLALNSRDAMPDGGDLTITLSNKVVKSDDEQDIKPGDYVVVEITDTGTGMPTDVMERAYEPFFTTKEIGKGSGLGLPSVYGFAKQSGGDVKIQSEVGVGTTISLYLPRVEDAGTTSKDKAAASNTLDASGLTVLILEDEPDVQKYLERLMGTFGFTVLTAGTAREAEQVAGDAERIDLLLSDVMLPGGVRGPEFATRLAERAPETAFLFISGRPSEARLETFPILASAQILQKPFAREALVAAIKSALDI